MSDVSQIIIPASATPTTLTFSVLVSPSLPPPVVTPPVVIPPPVVVPPAKMAIGTNVPKNDALNGAAIWCDAAKQLTGWYPNGGAVTYDSNDYPATVAAGFAACWTYLLAYPSGIYTLTWKGPQNGLSVVGKFLSPVSDGSGGWTATVPFNTGDRCELRTSTGGISKVSLMAPDAVAGQTFRTAYLSLLKPYTVLRLMDMQQTNGKQPSPGMPSVVRTDWASRKTAASFDQTTYETAPEFLAELCKEAKCIPYISIPYGAGADYIKGLATIFASFPVSIWGYGNELWNTDPGYQGNQIRADAQKKGFSGDVNQAGAKYHAALTSAMASTVKAIIPGAKIVFEAQCAWSQWAKDGLGSIAQGIVDYLGLGTYFQPQDGDPIATVADLSKTAQAWIDGILTTGLKDNAAVAKAYGCSLIAYEGSQSFIPDHRNSPPDEFTWSANISPVQWNAYLADPTRMIQFDQAMGTLMDNTFAACRSVGVVLYCNEMVISNWGSSGFWGIRQQTTDVPNVKTAAIDRAVAASL